MKLPEHNFQVKKKCQLLNISCRNRNDLTSSVFIPEVAIKTRPAKLTLTKPGISKSYVFKECFSKYRCISMGLFSRHNSNFPGTNFLTMRPVIGGVKVSLIWWPRCTYFIWFRALISTLLLTANTYLQKMLFRFRPFKWVLLSLRKTSDRGTIDRVAFIFERTSYIVQYILL